MKPELRALLREAPGAGELDPGDGAFRTGHGSHVVCGDLVEIDLRIRDAVVTELAWRAEGCPATLAVSAAAGLALPGCPVDQLAERLRARIAACGGLERHERHAEAMVLRAVEQALATAS